MCHRLWPSSQRPDNGERPSYRTIWGGECGSATGPSGMGGERLNPPFVGSSVIDLRTAHSTHVNGSADRVLWLADPYTRTGIRGRPARPRGSNFARCAPDRSLARLSSRAGAGRNTRGNPPARCYGGRAAAPRRRDAENLCEEVSEPQVEQHWQDQLGLELRVAGRPGRTAGAGLFAVGAEVVVTTVCC